MKEKIIKEEKEKITTIVKEEPVEGKSISSEIEITANKINCSVE